MDTRTLLLGPAGSGKTHRVLEEVRPLLAPGDAGRLRRFLVLVPTYSQAEHLKRRLVRQTGADGLFDRGVVTFEQLAERRTGIRLASLAPAAVRDALLAAAFEEDGSEVFAPVARFPGFRRAALRFLDEVKSLEPDPSVDVVAAAADRLAAVSGTLPGERAETVRALVRVLALFERRRRAEGLLDHGDLLRELLRLLREGGGGRYDLFVMDGFTDLTPVQEAIVHLVAASADRSVVTLLGDAQERQGSPFAATDDLRSRLVAAGFQPEHVGPTRRAGGLLGRLERRLAGEIVEPVPAGPSVRFLAGADPDDEADRVARTVLCWTTEGIARADILVVVRSAASETCARILDALRRHDVPARRMGGEPLAAVPCVRSALRVLRLLAETGAGRSEAADLAAALRQGDALGVADADADRVGLVFREKGPRDADAVVALAEEAGATTVTAWWERLVAARPSPSARPPAAVAASLLAPLGSLLRFRFAEPFDDADEIAVARDAAAMRTLRDLALDLVRALRAAGVGAVTPQDLAARIGAAAETARFARPDLRDDAVNVVDAEEARQWEARAVVVAGLRMGEFPATVREDLFLSDADRKTVAAKTGLALPNRMDQALRREHVLFYSAATRAKEFLVLTTPIAGDGGNPVLRSPFLDLALSLVLPQDRRLDGEDRSPGDVRPARGETLHRADLERTALGALTERFTVGHESEIRPQAGYALLPLLVPGAGAVVRTAARWFAPPEPSLRPGGPGARGVAGPRPRSATALSDFAQCPFRHFARKGLGLEERPRDADDGIDGLLAGTIAHRVLELAVQQGVTDAAAVAALADRVFKEQAGHLRHDLRAAAVRGRLRRAVVEHVVRWAADGGIVPGYVPAHFEWKFGPGAAPVAAGDGPDAVALVGAADRIDVDRAGRAIVIDYKWSERGRYAGIERKIDEGADLQLPMYVLAARKALGLRVVAAGYVTLRDGGEKWLRVTEDAPVGGGARSAPPPAGWGEGDGADGLARAEAHIAELDRRIRAGECATRPRDENRCGASRCSYADLCRFEGQPQ